MDDEWPIGTVASINQLRRSEQDMVKIRRVASTLMDPQKSSAKAQPELSPRALARQQQEKQFGRLLRKLVSQDDVFEVALDGDEKPITIRQRLMKVAAAENIDIAVRRRENGFLVGLMTPDRKERRGRRAKNTSAG